MAHSVLAVANEFIARAQNEGVRLTPMHLQKLCYMAHGFGLAFLNERLVDDEVEAWAYGPVYPELYDALKRYGSGTVDDLIHENNWASSANMRGEVVGESFTAGEHEVMKDVFEEYARFPAFKLSALTHEKGSPWEKVYQEDLNAIIPDDLIRSYFRQLAVA